MKRRAFLTTAGGTAIAGFAGCIEQTDTGDENGNGNGNGNGNVNGTGTGSQQSDDDVVVATYSAFLDAPSISPGEWVKEEFESEFDRNLIWQSPPNEINHYIQRQQEDVGIDADVYLGLNTEDLVRVDEELDDPLFAGAPDIEGRENIRAGLDVDDPQDRAIPFNTGYISLVYDGTAIEAPDTFDGLLDDEFNGDLIAQHPGTSTTGRAFMLHTVDQFGDSGDYTYLDFWADLQDNGVTILGSWGDAYGAWQGGEAPMVVSYSTDQVFADQEGADLEEHQIRFLNDQAYANPEGMAMFTDGNESAAREFMEFILRPDVQGEIAQQNVVFPATDNAELPADYDELAYEPQEAVTMTYEQLQGSVEGWIDDWEQEIAG